MGAVDAIKMARSRQEPGDIYILAHGKRLGVDLSVWLYQLLGFINPEDGVSSGKRVNRQTLHTSY